MGKSAPASPEPDPQIGQAALLQAQTGQDWLSFAKDAFAITQERQVELDALTKRVTDQQLAVSEEQLDFARQERRRYEQVFRPIEDDFIRQSDAAIAGSAELEERNRQYRDEIDEMRSDGYRERDAAMAAADVGKASADQRAMLEREMTSLGVSPASGRFMGIQRAAHNAEALGRAGAKNQARLQHDNRKVALNQAAVELDNRAMGLEGRKLGLKGNQVNMGRGLPAQAAGSAQLGLSAGAGAVGLNQANNAQVMQAGNIMNSGFQGQMAGYAGQANTLQNQWNTEVDIWRTQQQTAAQSAAGIGSALGGLFGLFLSDEDKKEDKAPVKDGEGLKAVNEMPVEEWTYKDGAGDGGRHVGPYAQDFHAATGKGDGKSIPVQDAIGLTMKAVQDLDDKVEKIAGVVTGLSKGRKNKRNAGAVGLRGAAA